ncbi:hypothetical protein LWF15_33655 [Kineosporia rhizophila]|uniref:hypothetical protein n=1 Tax=Kineosporia rhizophila TaxID=84633 RepID=UPI001E2DF295|nr:hypothetical protein [Kineosporia rhizophila]MCE0540452.1 hypothetical protein [Kineosporia rhizophila]
MGSSEDEPIGWWRRFWPGSGHRWPHIHRTVYAGWAARGRILLLRLVIVVGLSVWLVLRAVGLIDDDPHAAVFVVIALLPLAEHIRSRLSTRGIRRRWRSEARPQWRPQGRIDADLDQLLREGLGAALEQDGPRIRRAAADVEALGLDVTRHFRELLVAVNAMALYAVCGERWPNRDELKSLAQEFSQAHPYLEIPADRIQYFVTCLPKTNPTSSTFISSELLPIGFAFAAWLLRSFPKPANLGAWNFLNEIEDALSTGEGRFPDVVLV